MSTMQHALDFILRLNAEAREGLGEDSWCYSFATELGMIGAFDGCGGSGARKHAFYSGHSEAYIASRLCAGAFFDAFQDSAPLAGGCPAEQLVSVCAAYCSRSFDAYRPPAEQGARLRSSMIATLPTTAAAAALRPDGNALSVTAFWAGDSRVYLLTPEGLFQLSSDDSDDMDPFDTDAPIGNTVNADRAPKLNQASCRIPLPAIALTATDGCFAYYASPMEFEGALLSTLLGASCAQAWEQALYERIGSVAGDDYTMVLAAFGFRTFEGLKRALAPRYRYLYENYLSKIMELPQDDVAARRRLWEEYRAQYCKYIRR